ncbi:MAG: HIT domain-containing protein [Patescibacteria group bacterium]|jgi:histidine triad (HIT) family protein
MDDCLFCKIVRGEIPSYKIYEDDKYLAFLDIAQFTDGHTIVIPKKHFRFIWDIENVGEFYEFAVKVANHYRSLGYEFIDSASFGRLVPHAHYHLVPNKKDGNDWEKALENIGALQRDEKRRLTREKALETLAKFKLEKS